MDIKKMQRESRAKEQRDRILRGEIILPPLGDTAAAHIVSIAKYKARKARQTIWKLDKAPSNKAES